MNLYNVIATDFDGTPQGNNLYVRAADPQAAITYWQAYYETSALPESIDEVPELPVKGAIRWETVPRVWARSDRKEGTRQRDTTPHFKRGSQNPY